jgi:ubiquitin carboxyl-terminal hydrolase 7
MRLWPFTVRSNKVVRPGYIDTSPDGKTLEEIMFGHNNMPLFLEMLPVSDPRDSLPTFDKENDVLLFIKMYDPWNESLHYQGHITITIAATFRKLTN